MQYSIQNTPQGISEDKVLDEGNNGITSVNDVIINNDMSIRQSSFALNDRNYQEKPIYYSQEDYTYRDMMGSNQIEPDPLVDMGLTYANNNQILQHQILQPNIDPLQAQRNISIDYNQISQEIPYGELNPPQTQEVNIDNNNNDDKFYYPKSLELNSSDDSISSGKRVSAVSPNNVQNFNHDTPSTTPTFGILNRKLSASPDSPSPVFHPLYDAIQNKVNNNGQNSHSLEQKNDSKVLTKRRNQVFKPIPSRFSLNECSLPLSLLPSNVQCLSVLINYFDYEGELTSIPKLDERLLNLAYEYHGGLEMQFTNDCNEAIRLDYSQESNFTGPSQRIRYYRTISAIENAVNNIIYRPSENFTIHEAYEPQYYRFELDDMGNPINESKCGLCPYCKPVKFLPFKNSSYLSHLILEHGIYSTNYLVPEGIYLGWYNHAKDRNIPYKSHKKRRVIALRCPKCFDIVELNCWNNKKNGLLSYFRHFKDNHKDLTAVNTTFTNTPSVNIKTRGRKSCLY